MREQLAIFIIASSFLFQPQQAIAEPPPGVDLNSAISKWFNSLRDKEGNGCCSVADCRAVRMRMGPESKWEVFIDRQSFGATAPDDWVEVPDKALVVREDNPTGRNVACFAYHKLYCATYFGGI